MNFQSMEYFIELARQKNFTRAAQKLNVTQQSLSAHIASIEREVGCILVDRRSPLQLTHAGKVFLQFAVRQQSDLRSLRQEFGDIAGHVKGELRVGISNSRSQLIMPSVVTAFLQEHPHIQITIIERAVTLQPLLNGEVDLLITDSSMESPDIESSSFYEEKVVMLVSENLLQKYSVNPADVTDALEQGLLTPMKECPFILGTSAGLSTRIALEFFRRSGISPIIKAVSLNQNTVLRLCANEVGACFSPNHMVWNLLGEMQLSNMHIFPFPEQFGTSFQTRFVYIKRNYCWSMISEFIRVAQQVYPGLLSYEK